MIQGGVYCEGLGKTRSTSVTNAVIIQVQISQGGVYCEGLGKTRSTSVTNTV